MSIKTNNRSNRKVKQYFHDVTNAAWVKVVDQKDLKNVDREYFSLQVKGLDPTVTVLLTTDITVDEKACKEIIQGQTYENEFLYLQNDLYMKVKGDGITTTVTFWISSPNEF
jgi:hypothetical protein